MSAEKTELVVKANSLVEASYRLSLTEQQLILYAISRAREEQKGFSPQTPIKIEARAFAKQFNIDPSNVYDLIKTASRTLMTRLLSVPGVDEETGDPCTLVFHWVAYAIYVPRAAVVKFAFSEQVSPYLVRLEGEFTQYRLEQIGRMSSLHAVRIYELLLQYKDIGKREMRLTELKKMLDISEEYPRIFDLKKYVLEPSVDQINKFTDLQISYEQGKTGRTVTHLTFNIKQKAKAKPARQMKAPELIAGSREYIEKHARPGESYEAASRRLQRASP